MANQDLVPTLRVIGLVPMLRVGTVFPPLCGEPVAVRARSKCDATQSVAIVRSHAERGNE